MLFSRTDKENEMAEQPVPGKSYTVQSGDTLWGIAQRAYNDAEDWDTIYSDTGNRRVIGNNPNLIKPGQVLHIPQQSDPSIRKPPPHPTPMPTPHPTPTPTPTPPPTPTPTPYPTPTPPPTPAQPPDDENFFDKYIEDPIEKELKEKKED
jgi:LysM repeat protein